MDDVRIWNRRDGTRFGADEVGGVDVVNSGQKTFRRQRHFDVCVDLFVQVGALHDFLSRPGTGVTDLNVWCLVLCANVLWFGQQNISNM